jgi:tetratricopeptide (TPR) repeat protein
MLKTQIKKTLMLVIAVGIILTTTAAYFFIPNVQMRANLIATWVKGSLAPAGELPAAETSPKVIQAEVPHQSTDDLVNDPKVVIENQASSSVSLPQSAIIPSPAFDPKTDYQDWNNCGPATLALALRVWGWEGGQKNISAVIKPQRQDKNVNIEELAWYAGQYTEGLQAEIRVGGDLSTLKKFIAAGFPVVIEESFKVEKPAWIGDDLWAGHYILVTGYDDASELFTVQDTYHGPDRLVPYGDVEKDWQAFNHVYLLVFPQERQTQIQTLMGVDWQPEANIKNTIDALQSQLQLGQGNAFTWFNLGTNLVALGDYQSASSAFKSARQLGLPQRMLRYQFGPFAAAYHTGDLGDLAQLVDYSLKITPDSEEALYWKGQGFITSGDRQSAITFFSKALEANPGYQDAKNALAELLS